MEEQLSVQTPVKRRPGRPRKHPLPEQPEEKTKLISRRHLRNLASSLIKKKAQLNKDQRRMITLRLLAECLENEVLACTICLELMANPTTLACGHSFCLRCVHNNNKTEQKLRCALCRAPDFLPFYEVDPLIDRLITSVTSRFKEWEKKDYEGRKGLLPTGKTVLRLQVGDSVKVRQGDIWEPAEVKAVLTMGHRHFYKVGMTMSGLEYTIPSNSINLTIARDVAPKARRDSGTLFPGVFVEDPAVPPINEGYNIEELLWQVNYYPPAIINNAWILEPEPIQEMEDSDSIAFLGRMAPRGHNIIEID